jgi:hypothetical protein
MVPPAPPPPTTKTSTSVIPEGTLNVAGPVDVKLTTVLPFDPVVPVTPADLKPLASASSNLAVDVLNLVYPVIVSEFIVRYLK